MQYGQISDQTREVIKQQLGREPRGLLAVSKICVYGFPQVITNRPVFAELSQIEIFPTLYWLTCPYLCKEVALLETAGYIARFEDMIQEDPEFARQVEKNHRSYAQRRLTVIPDEVRRRIEEEYPERYKVLAESGVGGIRNLEGVKCLHCHLADQLVNKENIIGEKVVELISKPLFCAEGRCRAYIE
ncbi:MAG: DUF501 domain-containing protein [Firmicutes bacterium]|nr:DUF501 domain-containing protein [Bacillota bacterium]